MSFKIQKGINKRRIHSSVVNEPIAERKINIDLKTNTDKPQDKKNIDRIKMLESNLFHSESLRKNIRSQLEIKKAKEIRIWRIKYDESQKKLSESVQSEKLEAKGKELPQLEAKKDILDLELESASSIILDTTDEIESILILNK